MFNPTLQKVKLKDQILKLYFLELIEDEFLFCEGIKETAEKTYGALSSDTIERLTDQELIRLLGQHHVHEVYLFASDQLISWLSSLDLKTLLENRIRIPNFYTEIVQVSQDVGGLLVMEKYGVQIYELCTANGRSLLPYCHDLELGAEGSVKFRQSNSVFWETGKFGLAYENTEFDKDDPFFPSINNRDLIPMQIGTLWSEEADLPLIQMSDLNDAARILSENQNAFRILAPIYQNHPELALIAVNTNPLAFSLLDGSLQVDKKFVISVLNTCKEPRIIFNFLSDRMKNDPEILAICKFINETDLPPVEDDDLPF